MKMKLSSTFAASLLLLLTMAAPAAADHIPEDGHRFIHGVNNWLDPIPDQYRYSASWNGWVDDYCGTDSEKFRLVIYASKNFSGGKTRVCHASTNRTGSGSNDNWCELPLGADASWQAVDACLKSSLFGQEYGVANDRVSSLQIFGLTSNQCLRFFSDRDHQGRWVTLSNHAADLDDYQYPEKWYFFGDRISSLKVKSGSACDKRYGTN